MVLGQDLDQVAAAPPPNLRSVTQRSVLCHVELGGNGPVAQPPVVVAPAPDLAANAPEPAQNPRHATPMRVLQQQPLHQPALQGPPRPVVRGNRGVSVLPAAGRPPECAPGVANANHFWSPKHAARLRV